MTNWSIEEDELLIDFVKNHELLFNVKSKNHRKAQLKQNLWRDIGITLNKTDVECSKRWAYVRDYYIRRRGTGSSGEAAKRRCNLLSFLDGFTSSKRSTFNDAVGDEESKDINPNENVVTEMNTQVDNEEKDVPQHEELSEDDETENVCNEKRQNLDNALTPKKRKRLLQSEERLQLLKQISRRELTSSQDKFDEIDHFFMSMAKIVKKLPRYEQAQLRMQISTLVGNAELLHLSTQNDQTSRAATSCQSDVYQNLLSPTSAESHTLTLNEQREFAVKLENYDIDDK